MFFPKAIYCRIFQWGFRLAQPFLPYREPEIINSATKLGTVLKKENLRSVLIITDKGIVNCGLVDPIKKALDTSGIRYAIYDETLPNPTVDNVEEAFSIYMDGGFEGLIAIGGGSAMDCAKAVGARAAYPKRSLKRLGGILKVWRKLPPFVAIPTTAGTGSETTVAALITDSQKHHKYALMSFPLIPRYAVLDPKLTFSLPPHMTSTTGVDALTHAVEAYIGRSTTKETRTLALEATKLVFENIKTAYADGTNRVARENMLHASYKAGLAFSKSYVGYIHAIAHSLGGQYGTPHGLANAVLMPYLLEEYGESAHKKLHDLGIASGVSSPDDSHKVGAAAFIRAVKKLNADLDIPEKLRGIKEEDIPEMAKKAEHEANPLYPVPKLLTREELEKFYYAVADWSNT